MKNVRMLDIAQAAGVSLATVGRVIHDSGYVEAATREKIEAVIQSLGYVPNKTARNLKNQNSTLIGHMVLLNPNMLFHQISLAINASAEKAGYHVLTLTSERESVQEETIIDEFLSQNIAGIIITSNATIKDELLQKLVKKEVPVVMIERTRKMTGVDRVTVDDSGGMYTATEAMINKGKSHIAYIGSNSRESVEIERLSGFKNAMEAHGFSSNLIYEASDYDNLSGYLCAKAVLERYESVEGFICASDILASGVMRYLYEKGIVVPRDISVTGYDNTIASFLSPPINSVALSLKTLGDTAVSLILSRIARYEKDDEEIKTETIYIERNT